MFHRENTLVTEIPVQGDPLLAFLIDYQLFSLFFIVSPINPDLMKTTEFVIVYETGEIEQIDGPGHEGFQDAMSQSRKFTVYARDLYEAEFGPLDGPSSSFQDKMDSTGEPRVVSQQDKKPEPEQDPYRQGLISAYQSLEQSWHELFTQAVNLAMKGEWKEVDEHMEAGETLTFRLPDLAAVEDSNVYEIVRVLYTLEEAKESIANVNNLTDSEKNA